MKKLFPLIVLIASVFVFSSAERYQKQGVVKLSEHMRAPNRVIIAIESDIATELRILFHFTKNDPNSHCGEVYLTPGGGSRVASLYQSGQENRTIRVGAGISQLGLEIESSANFGVIEILSADGNTIQGNRIYTVGAR